VKSESGIKSLPSLLQSSTRQVWVQAIGRALYQMGYGLIQFYVPLIFVKQVGLSATAVGIGIGSGSLAGILGHLIGGYLADSPAYGRKRTLLFSAGLSIFSALLLTQTQSLPMLIIANLLLGLSAGCYWTAADAAVVDVTPSERRHQAFAILVLADSLGGGLGVLGGGFLLAQMAQTQWLFFSTSLIFTVFLVLIQLAVTETRQDDVAETQPLQGFVIALRDRSLHLFVMANILFTTYIALVNSTLPLYFTSVLSHATTNAQTPFMGVANLFTWCYIGIGAVLQLPIVQILNALSRVRVLMIAMGLWSLGFIGVWLTGTLTVQPLITMIAALSVLSIATAVYKPFAPAIVAELAPSALRAIYLAISYQCWSIGYFIGPILGGWVIDQPEAIAHHAWIWIAASSIVGFVILHFLSVKTLSDSIDSNSTA
jgi:MFS family permease